MYNGIGLSTVRGSGTNGYVTRNLSHVRPSKDKVNYKTEDDIKKSEAALSRGPNQGILDHERKRKLEVKCLELEDVLKVCTTFVKPNVIKELINKKLILQLIYEQAG